MLETWKENEDGKRVVGTLRDRKKGFKRAIAVARRARRREGLVEMPVQGSSCNVTGETQSQNPHEQLERSLLPPVHRFVVFSGFGSELGNRIFP